MDNFVYCFGLLTVSLGQENENEEIEETLTEALIKRHLRARPLRGGSSPLRWGKRWGTLANGARYGKCRNSERMSFEESFLQFLHIWPILDNNITQNQIPPELFQQSFDVSTTLNR